MKNDSKLRVVGTIEERIETILTKLNSNILVEESEMTDITNLFLPNIENLYNIVDQNKEYTLAFFSVPILDERHYYEKLYMLLLHTNCS